jgi:hypothetical protein
VITAGLHASICLLILELSPLYHRIPDRGCQVGCGKITMADVP